MMTTNTSNAKIISLVRFALRCCSPGAGFFGVWVEAVVKIFHTIHLFVCYRAIYTAVVFIEHQIFGA